MKFVRGLRNQNIGVSYGVNRGDLPPDPVLGNELDAYRVQDMDPSSAQALLDKIVAAVAAKNPVRPNPSALWSRRKVSALALQLPTMAFVAFLGFGIGTSMPQTMRDFSSFKAEEADLAEVEYLDQIIFGPTSWKEVSL
ncbi:MAG: hypothetical protein PHS57_08940 [Alphaproteobacteria bacterium]|nr:hypothetical protein [Alphaproteobacteria bacterium]